MEVPKKTFIDVTKAGAISVLTLWLFNTNARIKQVEEQLYKCMEGKSITSGNNTHKEETIVVKSLAILPDKPKMNKK